MTLTELDEIERLVEAFESGDQNVSMADIARHALLMSKAIRGLYATAAEKQRTLLRLHERRDALQTQFNKLERDHRILSDRFNRMYLMVQAFLMEWTKQ